MRRILAVLVVVACGVVGLATGADDPYRLIPDPKAPFVQMPEAPYGTVLVPAPGYVPQIGDRLHLYSQIGQTAIGKDSSDLIDLVKAALAKDQIGVQKIEGEKRVAKAATGTGVIILERAIGSIEDEEFGIVKVRLTDGPYSGQTAWCVAVEAARLVPVPKSRAQMKAEQGGVKAREEPGDEQRAQSLFLVAQAHEKAGRFGPAREGYERVVKELPATPQAKKAAERIEAIKGK